MKLWCVNFRDFEKFPLAFRRFYNIINLIFDMKARRFRCVLFVRAPVAQLDSASVFGTEGWGFESLQACFRGLPSVG